MKIAIFPFAKPFAHIGRCLKLGSALLERGHHIHFCHPPNLTSLNFFHVHEKFIHHHVREVDTTSSPFSDFKSELRYFINKDRKLISSEIKPDIIVTDHRSSASLAASSLNIPTVSLIQASSLGSRCKLKIPQDDYNRLFLGQTNFKSQKASNKAFHFLQDHILQEETLQLLHHLGIKNKTSIQDLFIGDLNMIMDSGEVFPIHKMKKYDYQCGPILCSGKSTKKLSINKLELKKENKKLILVQMGKSETTSLFPEIINQLTTNPDHHVLAVHSAITVERPSQVEFIDFINFDDIFPMLDLQVCHGGSIGLYYAQKHKIPSIVIPGNLDQKINAIAFSQNGLCAYMTKEEFYVRPYHFKKLINKLEQKKHDTSSLTPISEEVIPQIIHVLETLI